jgi:hypothetical protein
VPLIKAILLGMIAAIGMSFFLTRAGYALGGVLALHGETLAGFGFYWSWPIFCVVTGLAWGILRMMN